MYHVLLLFELNISPTAYSPYIIIFVRYLYHACWYAWLGMKWWSLVESAVKQAVVLPLFMYEIIAIAALLLTQVCAFVCDACYKAFVRMQGFAPFHGWNHHNWLKFARTQAPLCAKSNQTNIDQQRKALTRWTGEQFEKILLIKYFTW